MKNIYVFCLLLFPGLFLITAHKLGFHILAITALNFDPSPRFIWYFAIYFIVTLFTAYVLLNYKKHLKDRFVLPSLIVGEAVCIYLTTYYFLSFFTTSVIFIACQIVSLYAIMIVLWIIEKCKTTDKI